MIAADGVNGAQVEQMKKALLKEGATIELIAPKLGDIKADKNSKIPVDKSLMTVSSVLYDAVYIPGGAESIKALLNKPDATEFISQAYKHCKPIAFETDALPLIEKTKIGEDLKKIKIYPAWLLIQPLS